MTPPAAFGLRSALGYLSLAAILSLTPVDSSAAWADEPEAVVSACLEEALAQELAARLGHWPSAEQTAPGPPDVSGLAAERPIDLGMNWGVDRLICPSYWPPLYPEKTLDELCRADYFSSPWLGAQPGENRLAVARDELARLHQSARERRRRLPWAVAYAYLHRDTRDWAPDTMWALLGERKYLTAEVLTDVLVPVVLRVLPDSLTQVESAPGLVPIDVRVFTNASFDSPASTERMLLEAAARGLKGVAIADRTRTDGAQKAERDAARLKAQGRLPRDFLVIRGQTVYTQSGSVLALFADRPIPEDMTMERTIGCIHAAGGLAYLIHPAVPGGPERLARMDFDGYLIQPGMFEMFRTLLLLNDPHYANRAALAGSSSLHSGTVGLPYTLVEAEEVSAPAIKQALRERRASASGGLYLPWMTAASYPPVARFSRFLSGYFGIHAFAERRVARWIGADNVMVSTSWDEEIRSMIGIGGLPGGLRDLFSGTSPLQGWPRVKSVEVEYSWFRVGYERETRTAFLRAHVCW